MEKSLEQQCLKQLATDDKKAYEIIFKAHYQSVYLSALRITKDANSAKDAAQEVFLELWKNRYKLNITSSLKGYLCRGAVNRSLNSIKSRNHHAGQDLANPARPYSRLGVKQDLLDISIVDKVEGFMFHMNCENKDVDAFIAILDHISNTFSEYLKKLKSP